MIDPKELMIGNWVLFKREPWDNGEYRQVKGVGSHIDLATPNCKLATMMASKENVYPIQLTEKLFCDLGYTKVNVLHDGTIVFSGEPYMYFKDGEVRTSTRTIRIDSFHKFQNVLYLLSGKELEINL